MRLWIAALALCSLGTGVLAQSLPAILREDAPQVGPRALGDAVEAARWNAVGRLDTGASFCSATLIAPDLVLTAAHCLFHPRTAAAFDPGDLIFSAGLRNGHAAAVRNVRRALIVPGYSPAAGEDLEMIGRDLALLELQHPIVQNSIRPIATGRIGNRPDPVTVVSYGADRDTYASIEEDCEILARRGSVRSLSCEVVSGASGSPVLRLSGAGVEVVAVMSAIAEQDGEEFAIAVALEDQFAALLNRHAMQPGIGAPGATEVSAATGASGQAGSTGATFLGPGNDGRDSIGARFIRP